MKDESSLTSAHMSKMCTPLSKPRDDISVCVRSDCVALTNLAQHVEPKRFKKVETVRRVTPLTEPTFLMKTVRQIL